MRVISVQKQLIPLCYAKMSLQSRCWIPEANVWHTYTLLKIRFGHDTFKSTPLRGERAAPS